jgi:site-specific recombinase XerD
MARKLFDVLAYSELEQMKAIKNEKSQLTYLRNNLIFDFLFFSGIRVSELVNIKHQD